MHNPLGTCLIESLNGITKQAVGIFDVPCLNGFNDIFATIPHERPAGTVPFPGGDILTKPLFGTGNVRHK